MIILHITKLEKGYSLRVEQPEEKYWEFWTFEEMVKVMREEFGEGDGRND